MRISILIVTKKYSERELFSSWDHLALDEEIMFEVIVAEGCNPSTQRNELANVARGEYLLFFDEDSEPDFKILLEYLEVIKKFPEAAIFGGPSLLKTKSNNLHQILNKFFSSYLGIGPFKSRYNSLGSVRITNEKELILSNLLIKKDYFTKSGGFDHGLYPGEENDYIKRQKGNPIIYNPLAVVYRFPRETLKDFFNQMYSYGKGRAKHLGWSTAELIFLLPAIYAIYFTTLFTLPFLFKFESLKLLYLPILIYFFSIIVISALEFHTNIFLVLASALCFTFGHFFYGLGVLFGLCKYRILPRGFRGDKKLENLKIFQLKEFK